MRLALATFLLSLPVLAATFTVSWWSVDYSIEAKPFTVNGTKVFVTYVYPKSIIAPFDGDVSQSMTMICMKSDEPSVANVILMADVQAGSDVMLSSYAFLLPANVSVCQPVPMAGKALELIKGGALKELVALYGLLKGLYALPAFLAGSALPPLSLFSSIVTLAKDLRGLYLDVYINGSYVGRFYEVKVFSGSCLKVFARVPLVPGRTNEVVVKNACSKEVVADVYLDNANAPDWYLGKVVLKPHEKALVKVYFNDPYKKFFKYERFARDIYFDDNGITLASLPVFDVARYLYEFSYAKWFNPNGEEVNELEGEGTYRACVVLPKAVPNVDLNQTVTLMVVEDKALAPDVVVAEKDVRLKSLNDLNNTCVSFFAEIHWNTRGYKLVLEIAGAKAFAGELYREAWR